MKEGIAETLARIDKMVARQDRIDALRQDHTIGMENIIDVCFNENLHWLLPVGSPPYKIQEKELDLQHVLYSQIRKLGIFIDSGNSFAFPLPKPAFPFPLPTTTNAAVPNLLPPLTTLETLFT